MPGEMCKTGHKLVLSIHQAESFPRAIELVVHGLQSILSARSVNLYSKRYHTETGELLNTGSESPCKTEDGVMNVVDRSIWPRENLCLTFCLHYDTAPSEDDLICLDMILEQLLCAGGHLPAEPDVDIEQFLLSKREREVLPMVASGQSNGEIARELGISERTVEKHVASILEKTGLANRKLIIATFQGARATGSKGGQKGSAS